MDDTFIETLQDDACVSQYVAQFYKVVDVNKL